MKKSAAVLLIITMSFMICSCSITASGQKKVTTPEECIQTFYGEIIAGNYETAYDTYFADVSKSIIDKVDYSNDQKNKYFTESITLTDVLVNSSEKIENIDETVYIVKGKLKFTKNGTENTEDFFDYVIKQKSNGFYRYLYNGILMKKDFNMASTHESNLVHATNMVLYDSIEGLYIDLSFKNDTGKKYKFGSDSGSIMQITIGDKVYSYQLAGPIDFEGKSEAVLKGYFKDSHGQPEKISVSNIYEIGKDGTIMNSGSGQTYSLKITS